MYPSTKFSQNLRFPETGLNFAMNIFFNKSGIITLFDPNNYKTSANIELLKRIDPCKETVGKVSFIPLDFLETYLINNKIIDSAKKINNKLELKKYYLEIFKKLNIFNKKFFDNETYKDIPLKYFRKPYLNSELTKAIDFCKINTEDGPAKDLNDTNLFTTINPNNIIERNENEWLSKSDLTNILLSKIFSLKKFQQDQIWFIPLIYLKNTIYNLNFTYSDILNSYNWNEIPKNRRFIIFLILYRSHFSSVIIDQNVLVNKERKKIAYFFNSCGYDPNYFNYNHDFWFIDGVYKIINHKKLKTKKEYSQQSIPIEALCLILKNKLNVTNFVFNIFCIQYFDSECGIFSSMFLFFFLNMFYYKNNDISILDLKYIYFNSLTLGNDLIYGLIRGLLFFTKEDIDFNNIYENIYHNSADIYNIKNRKFMQYNKLYLKNLNHIIEIFSNNGENKIY